MAKSVLSDLDFAGVSRIRNLPLPANADEAARFGDVEPMQQVPLVAGENLGSSTFVAIDPATGLAVRADAVAGLVARGYTRGAVNSGDPVQLRSSPFLNGFAGLVPGSVYFLGVAGGLALIPPTTTGVMQRLGTASAADTLTVALGEPIRLAG